MNLLLFDVDLTLINTGGAGRQAMTQAFADQFGIEDGFQDVSFAGRTDVAILKDGLSLGNLSWTTERQTLFKARYLTYLKDEITKPNLHKRILPGIPELLASLLDRRDVTLALLTGNWSEGARIKLDHFDLYRFFEFGAFADDSEFRDRLPFKAAAKFTDATGKVISPERVFVIGDTPKDVECARPFGARTVAVATGFYDYEELQTARPDHLFHDFSNIDQFHQIIG